MNDIRVRYGSIFNSAGTTDDPDVISIDFVVGKAGEVAKINQNFAVADGAFTVALTALQTSIPLGTYSYQVNLNYATGGPKKLPDPTYCSGDDDGLPNFIVLEALDATEVTS